MVAKDSNSIRSLDLYSLETKMPPDEIATSFMTGLSAFLTSVMAFGTMNSIPISALQEKMGDFELQCVLY